MHPLPLPSFFCLLCYAVLYLLVPLCRSVLSHLAVCNSVELMMCWCVLIICISGSTLLDAYSNIFVISTMWISLSCIRPLPLFSGNTSVICVCLWMMLSMDDQQFHLFLILFLQFCLAPVNNSKTIFKYWYCK